MGDVSANNFKLRWGKLGCTSWNSTFQYNLSNSLSFSEFRLDRLGFFFWGGGGGGGGVVWEFCITGMSKRVDRCLSSNPVLEFGCHQFLLLFFLPKAKTALRPLPPTVFLSFYPQFICLSNRNPVCRYCSQRKKIPVQLPGLSSSYTFPLSHPFAWFIVNFSIVPSSCLVYRHHKPFHCPTHLRS